MNNEQFMLTPLLVFVGALLIAFGATPVARCIAPRLGVMDVPNPRKIHARPMPLLGHRDRQHRHAVDLSGPV
jgi:UDP-N-acetylmuramyl pentapeptide phosphotransferase/UDP-N-acetylglucosamine-1-phosphate transferase